MSLVNRWDNLIIVRTFSKGFGLAGLRAGYIVVLRALGTVIEIMPGEMNMTSVADAMFAPGPAGSRFHRPLAPAYCS